jgi:opacity protein-like surface antigen
MKKTLFLAGLFLAVVFTAVAADVIVTVVNDTGYDVYYLYVSRSDSDDWGDDLLDDEILGPGEGFQVSLPTGTWDIMVEDEDEDTYTKSEVRVTKSTVIKMTIADLD